MARDYVFFASWAAMRWRYSIPIDKIALGHAQYIDFAVKYANKVAFIDTVSSPPGHFAKIRRARASFVRALIDEYRRHGDFAGE